MPIHEIKWIRIRIERVYFLKLCWSGWGCSNPGRTGLVFIGYKHVPFCPVAFRRHAISDHKSAYSIVRQCSLSYCHISYKYFLIFNIISGRTRLHNMSSASPQTTAPSSRVLTHWSLGNFNIVNDIVLQQLARQAPVAQDAAGACHAGYCR